MYNSATVPAVSDGILNLNPTGSGVDVKLINNTIAYNTSARTTSGATPGLYVRGLTNKTTLINNILFSNFDSQATPVSKSIGNATNILFKESHHNITDEVTGAALGLATTLANNGGATKTLLISNSSVAVNAGYVTNAPLVDQRNTTRLGTPDVGAYETAVAAGINSSYQKKNIVLLTKEGFISTQKGNLQVISVGGVMIKNFKITEDEKVMLQQGVYIILLTNENGAYVQKIIL
jgi:hypothetical protein